MTLLIAIPIFNIFLSDELWSIIHKIVREHKSFFQPFAYHKVCIKKDHVFKCCIADIENRLRRYVEGNQCSVRTILKILNKTGLTKREAISIVIHTEYQCMIWNWNELIDVYVEQIVNYIQRLRRYGVGIQTLEIEFHPGFIKCGKFFETIKLSELERGVHTWPSIIDGMIRFIKDLLNKISRIDPEVEIRVTVENRGQVSSKTYHKQLLP